MIANFIQERFWGILCTPAGCLECPWSLAAPKARIARGGGILLELLQDLKEPVLSHLLDSRTNDFLHFLNGEMGVPRTVTPPAARYNVIERMTSAVVQSIQSQWSIPS